MKIFNNLTENEEAFKIFMDKQQEDDNNVKKYLNDCSHKDFVFTLIRLGTLLNTVATYTGFVQEQLNNAIKLDNNLRNRKISKIVKDLNEKINDKYNFEKSTTIIESVVLYDNELYMFINQFKFIKTLEVKEIVAL